MKNGKKAVLLLALAFVTAGYMACEAEAAENTVKPAEESTVSAVSVKEKKEERIAETVSSEKPELMQTKVIENDEAISAKRLSFMKTAETENNEKAEEEIPVKTEKSSEIPDEGMTAGTGVLEVNGKTADTSEYPYPWVNEKAVILVPIRPVAESLGYKVTWNADENTAFIEDSIQGVYIKAGERIVRFKGKLKVIDLSGEEEMQEPPRLIADRLYAPVVIFRRFFNNVLIMDNKISIEPQKVYIQDEEDKKEQEKK